jgi:hypothetical protein
MSQDWHAIGAYSILLEDGEIVSKRCRSMIEQAQTRPDTTNDAAVVLTRPFIE